MIQLLVFPGEAAAVTRLRPGLDAALLEPELQTLQQRELPQMLGADLLAQLMTQKQNRTLTTANDRLLALLKPGIAWLAVGRALPALHWAAGGNGVQVPRQEGHQPAPAPDVAWLAQDYVRRGLRLLQAAQQLLQQQAHNYPLYAGSAPVVGGVHIPKDKSRH